MSFPSRIILSTPPKIVGKKEKLVQNALLAQRAPIPTMPVVPSFIQEAYIEIKKKMYVI